ncbi:hypothetical protein WJX72_004975 [[Myrmecia] bisecta]|uniref:CBM1 domain-containing protein n=1 Tax=[Myrmecia] bisecta TaxID=41462 RepID=A0AAW1PGW4_9CHLO
MAQSVGLSALFCILVACTSVSAQKRSLLQCLNGPGSPNCGKIICPSDQNVPSINPAFDIKARSTPLGLSIGRVNVYTCTVVPAGAGFCGMYGNTGTGFGGLNLNTTTAQVNVTADYVDDAGTQRYAACSFKVIVDPYLAPLGAPAKAPAPAPSKATAASKGAPAPAPGAGIQTIVAFGQCGGLGAFAPSGAMEGPWAYTMCEAGYTCSRKTRYYYQCLRSGGTSQFIGGGDVVGQYSQCGGKSNAPEGQENNSGQWTGPLGYCAQGFTCTRTDDFYSQCRPSTDGSTSQPTAGVDLTMQAKWQVLEWATSPGSSSGPTS